MMAVTMTVHLKNSSGTLIPGGILEYREGGGAPWQTATETSDGVFSFETDHSQVALIMNYDTQKMKVSEIPTDGVYTFQTVLVTVELRKSDASLGYNGGVVGYTSYGWQDFGVTGDHGLGIVEKEMLPIQYTFRMIFMGELQKTTQTISTANNTITFDADGFTSEADRCGDNEMTVFFVGSHGGLMSGGVLEYKEGVNSDYEFASEIKDGIFCVPSDRETIKLRLSYGPQQQIATNVPTDGDYIFQSELVTVELRCLNGILGHNGGVVDYTSDGFWPFGTTGDDGLGIVQQEMLPVQYTFRMIFMGERELKTEIISPSNNVITFYPSGFCDEADACGDEEMTVFFVGHTGELMSGGILEYKEGAAGSWEFATESRDGVFCIDSDRETIKLRLSYGPQEQVVANVPTDEDFIFQSVLVTVELRCVAGGLGHNGGVVDYTSDGFHAFGITGDDGLGIVQKEMLPVQYTFRMLFMDERQSKTQIISAIDNLVSFCVTDFAPEADRCDDDNMTVFFVNSTGNLLSGGVLEYKEGRDDWEYASEPGDGVFCIPTDRETLKLRLTYGPQEQSFADVPTSSDFLFQTELVTVELLDGSGNPMDGGEVQYTSDGWHVFGTTGDDGSGIVQKQMLPVQYTFQMKYGDDKLNKTEVISPFNNYISYNVNDLKKSVVNSVNAIKAYPNPFNGNTNIVFNLETSGNVIAKIYNLQGQLVDVLFDGSMSEGEHIISWNGNGSNGSSLEKGMYIIHLVCPTYSNKVTVIKF
jgi:hypothetical protein